MTTLSIDFLKEVSTKTGISFALVLSLSECKNEQELMTSIQEYKIKGW